MEWIVGTDRDILLMAFTTRKPEFMEPQERMSHYCTYESLLCIASKIVAYIRRLLYWYSSLVSVFSEHIITNGYNTLIPSLFYKLQTVEFYC